MRIYPFAELSEEQRRDLCQFIEGFEYKGYRSYGEMVKSYGGITFDNGKSHFSLWENSRLIGTLGVISKEAAIRGEIFLVGISLKEPDAIKLEPLLFKAFDYCSGIANVSYKLGLNYDRYYMIPVVEKNGFKEVYRYLEMRYSGSNIIPPPKISECCKNLSLENIKDFQRVHNAAFLLAPNGAPIEDSELQEYLEKYRDSNLAGIYYEAGSAAGIYLLKLDGTEGYIDGIGVAPEFHGRGIGKKLLFKSIRVLQDSGAEKIGLSVFNNNTKAINLYLKNGFDVESEHSVWYEK